MGCDSQKMRATFSTRGVGDGVAEAPGVGAGVFPLSPSPGFSGVGLTVGLGEGSGLVCPLSPPVLGGAPASRRGTLSEEPEQPTKMLVERSKRDKRKAFFFIEGPLFRERDRKPPRNSPDHACCQPLAEQGSNCKPIYENLP